MKSVWKLLGLSAFSVVVLVVIAVILNNTGVKRSAEAVDPTKPNKKGLFKSKKSVAILEVEGVIFDSKAFAKKLERIITDEKPDALVVRINSPGGVVAPSQEMYSAIKALKIPTVASMGSVAASGGYYLAVGCNKIVANPGTITGSIGVIMELVNLQGVYEWAKVKRFALTTGKYKNSGADYKPLADDERKLIQSMIDNVLSQFKSAVKLGRSLTDAEVDAVADGRIFSGEQAKAVKLVDELGGLEEAILLAGKLAGSDGRPNVIRTQKKKTLREFFEQLGDEEESEYEGRSHSLSANFSALLMRMLGKGGRDFAVSASDLIPKTIGLSPGLYVLWRPGVGI